MSNIKGFGEFIFKTRMEHKLTLTELANLVGISANYVSELERGKKEPSDEIIRKIAQAYNMPEELFFDIIRRVPLGIKEEMKKSPELRELLNDIAKNKNLTEDVKETLYKKIHIYYDSLLNEME